MTTTGNDFLELCEILGFPKELMAQAKQIEKIFGEGQIKEELEKMHDFLHLKGYFCGHCECGHINFKEQEIKEMSEDLNVRKSV